MTLRDRCEALVREWRGCADEYVADLALGVTSDEVDAIRRSAHDLQAALDATEGEAGDGAASGFRVIPYSGGWCRGTERWEIYDDEGSGGVVEEDDVPDPILRRLLDSLATAQAMKESKP
jgi:hypothetical protein